jgi:hypothetical protein
VSNVLTGTLSLNANGGFSYAPPLNYFGTVTFTYRASDGLTNSNVALVTIVIDPVNDAPTLTPLVNQVFTIAQTSASQNFTIGDVDTPLNALTLAFTSTNTALVPLSGISLVGTGATRSIQITPTPFMTGTATITLSVSDGLSTTSQSFTVNVGMVLQRLFLPVIMKQP